jgi:hypothetical protein
MTAKLKNGGPVDEEQLVPNVRRSGRQGAGTGGRASQLRRVEQQIEHHKRPYAELVDRTILEESQSEFEKDDNWVRSLSLSVLT